MARRISAILALCLAASVGCVEPDSELNDSSSQGLTDGTPEGVGLLAFLNDPATTFEILDVTVALDRRAAENLMAARPFATVDDVDAVRWVGPSAMGKLVAYADANGWVPSGSDVLGTYDGVAFTVDQAGRALRLVNDESEAALDDDVGLDPRAVASILAARPVSSVLELSGLYWVGKGMLTRIRDYDAPVVVGADCQSNADCEGASIYCTGRPHDGSGDLGVCRDLSNVPGASDDCDSDDDCLDGLACSGLTVFTHGYCRPHWMFASFSNDDSKSLPMSDVVVTSEIVVRGLASVPEDIVVELDLIHVEYGDLVITLVDPSTAEAVLWDGPHTSGPMPTRFLVLDNSRDADVNGRWTLKVTNPSEHGFGTLRGWTLDLSSRFD